MEFLIVLCTLFALACLPLGYGIAWMEDWLTHYVNETRELYLWCFDVYLPVEVRQ